jgi:hypothetical protein
MAIAAIVMPGQLRAARLSEVLVPALCCASAMGCGGSSHQTSTAASVATQPAPVAQRVCAAERRAADALTGGALHVQIADSDPANIECLLRGGAIRLDVVAQASARAWTQYDTTTVHLVQAFGSGSVHHSAELPHPVPGLGGNAVWVPAQSELIATNGTQSTGGTYVTINIMRGSARGPSSLSVARAVARATLASAPRGPSPGPPPS